MSTQEDSGVSFDISNEQQNFRLLELPPALLALITSRDPPNAVLCTNDLTYQIRQVQSSNSVFILQPSESHRGVNEIPSPNLSAIAKCTATLELVLSDTAASFAMVSRLLKENLPPYKGTDTDAELGTNTTFSKKYKDKDAILQDTPFSPEEFDKTWKQLCAFEVLGGVWLPTPSALAMIWNSILSAATIRGVSLEKTFDLESIAKMVCNDGYPWELFMAVMVRLVSDTTLRKDDGPCRITSGAPVRDTIFKEVNLSRDETVQWVGMVCLQRAGESEQANAEGIPQSQFLARWHDLLPEGWRKHASMDLLKAKFSHPDPSKERIVFCDDIFDPTSLETISSAKYGKANRKWHEKFKMGRK